MIISQISSLYNYQTYTRNSPCTSNKSTWRVLKVLTYTFTKRLIIEYAIIRLNRQGNFCGVIGLPIKIAPIRLDNLTPLKKPFFDLITDRTQNIDNNVFLVKICVSVASGNRLMVQADPFND